MQLKPTDIAYDSADGILRLTGLKTHPDQGTIELRLQDLRPHSKVLQKDLSKVGFRANGPMIIESRENGEATVDITLTYSPANRSVGQDMKNMSHAMRRSGVPTHQVETALRDMDAAMQQHEGEVQSRINRAHLNEFRHL